MKKKETICFSFISPLLFEKLVDETMNNELLPSKKAIWGYLWERYLFSKSLLFLWSCWELERRSRIEKDRDMEEGKLSVAETCLTSFSSWAEALLPFVGEGGWADEPSIPLGFWRRIQSPEGSGLY